MILSMIMMLENEEERSFVEGIYYDYNKQMMSICMAILKNTDDAKEAVSETFARIMDNLDPFIESESLEGLLMVTTRHVACDYYNKKKKRNENESSSTYYDENNESSLLDIPDTSASVERALLDNEFMEEVKQLLKDMPSDVSTIVVYKYLYRYRNIEIAEMLGIDRSLVNLKLHRARKKLKELLADRYPES